MFCPNCKAELEPVEDGFFKHPFPSCHKLFPHLAIYSKKGIELSAARIEAEKFAKVKEVKIESSPTCYIEDLKLHIYCGTESAHQEFSTLGFAPHDENSIVLTLGLKEGTKKAIIKKIALAGLLKELSLACEKYGNSKIQEKFSDISVLNYLLHKAQAKIEELNHEIMKLKEKEE